MAHLKLRSPDQPLVVRCLLGLYEVLASMSLAVVLLVALAFVLGWATFIESWFGTEAVHFAVYDAWWFAALLALLGVNVLCAALIRFPWRRYQTGFVITHAGILVLLVGCIYSAGWGIDAQMYVFEGSVGHKAYERTRHFELRILPDDPQENVSVIDVPFRAGPFNWRDYRSRFPFPWQLGKRDQGLICDQNSIQLEVLDFYRLWTPVAAKPLKVFAAVTDPESGALGDFDSIELKISQADSAAAPAGARGRTENGVRFTYTIARTAAEAEAFRMTGPQGDLGEQGQVVIYVRGSVFRFQVDDWKPEVREPLGDTGYEVEFFGMDAAMRAARLLIHAPDGTRAGMALLAELPDFSMQLPDHGVFGSYWLDVAADAMEPMSQFNIDPAEPRIDLMQAPDGAVAYRVWQSPQLQEAMPVIAGRREDVTLAADGRAMRFYVESIETHDRPGMRLKPLPFDKEDARRTNPIVRVRLTVDGQAEEFWLGAQRLTFMDEPRHEFESRVVVGDGRRVELRLVLDSFDVGFHVYLNRFQRKLDPGSRTAVSEYSSLVDFVTVKDDGQGPTPTIEKVLEEDVLITLNNPITRVDPSSGRSFRMYQEAFDGPYRPGTKQYEYFLGGVVPRGETEPRDELYQSTLTVNYDPGRGLKYVGCLMIVAGTAVLFYMKGYFFRRRRGEDGEE